MKTVSAIIVIFAAFVLSGCQHSGAPIEPATQAMTPGSRAVVVSGGNGGSTTVFLPSADSAHPMMLCTAGSSVGPDCKVAAIRYFQTGVLEPKCSRTGATRTLLIPATPNVSHN